MSAGRKIWLIALLLCVTGVLGCVGLGIWLAGVSWSIERHQGTDPASPDAGQGGRLILFVQSTVFMAAAIFMTLTALLALLWRRLQPGEPPRETETTDIWRRNVPPADDAERLESQWQQPPPANAEEN